MPAWISATPKSAARHADPRTTMRYERARNNLDRHPNYILAAYMSSGT
jgi:integrase/recombinase XerD